MSPFEDNINYITTATGSIDYAYYENEARTSRAQAFSGIGPAFNGIFRGLRQRLKMPAPLLANGPAASPCG